MSWGSAKSNAEALISTNIEIKSLCPQTISYVSRVPGKDSENRSEAYASLTCDNLSRARHVKCYQLKETTETLKKGLNYTLG